MKTALAEALARKGYDTLTPVQQAVTAADLGQADLLVSAQTGSGKTVGFGLAIADTLLGDAEVLPPAGPPLALVIAPTRELAMQVRRELTWLYAQAGATVTSCVGGMDMRDERRALDRGAHIVVATPGRLRDHIMRGALDMSGLRAVVLDEADEMLDLGFREDLEFILGEAPESRRTLMFSATVPKSIATLARNYQKDARRITTASGASQHADIDYRALDVAFRDAENAIINVLRFYEAPNALVFCNTRAMVNRLLTRFSNRGFAVVALSGELTQTERSHALQAMRDGRARVCIATDVAARGIDLPNLELVIHADLPTSAETLLHRSGRTGRAGRKGVSVLIVPPKARRRAEMLLGDARVKATWAEAPSADEVIARDGERLLADPVWEQEISETEALAAAPLVERFPAEILAAAYVRLWNARQSAPEDLSPVQADAPAAPRAGFGPATWFAVSGGRAAGAEPRRLLPMLCKAGNLSRGDIGAIRVQDSESFVEILSASVPDFLDAIGPEMRLEAGQTLRRLAAPPPMARRAPRGATGADRQPRAGWQEEKDRLRPRRPRGPAPAPEPSELRETAARRADPPEVARPAAPRTPPPEPRASAAAEAPEPPRAAPAAAPAPDPSPAPAPKPRAVPGVDPGAEPPVKRIKLRHKSAAGKAALAARGSGGAPIGKPGGKTSKARAPTARPRPAGGGNAMPKRPKGKPAR